MKDFDIFLQKLPINMGNLGKIILPQALKSCPGKDVGQVDEVGNTILTDPNLQLM